MLQVISTYTAEKNTIQPCSTLKLNDLWKYNIKTNEWTWLNGDSVPGKSAVYGVQGLASASNSPGSRQWGSSWTDAIGNFWLFGGRTQNDYYYRNDLWKYDVRLNQLIWIKGDSVPGAASIYGTQGLAMAANKPGGRAKGITWADTLGNLWLFGGVATGGGMNDLWKYTIATNNWTWVTGDTISAALPVYGTKKVANIANRPGGRQLACSWIDKYGKLWLFGGNVHYRYNDITDLNDLWKFDPSTTEWTWMSGDTTKNPWGVYGVKGIGQPQNKPGGRSFGNNWIDNTGNFWLSGGDGLGSHFSAGLLNDVWKYMPLVDRWIWMSGDSLANSPSNFGALGVAAFTNDPGGRRDAMQWTDQTGNFWLFGGYSTYKAYNNDLWKYIPIVNPNLLVFSVFADQNRDGLKQPSEPFFHNASALIVKQSTGFSTNISSSTGTFAFPVDSGTYTIRPALP